MSDRTAIDSTFFPGRPLMAGRACVHRSALAALLPFVSLALFWAILPEGLAANEASDYRFRYEPLARSLLDGKGYAGASGEAYLAYPPGFPAILAALFYSADALGVQTHLALNALILACASAASVFLFLIARALWGDSRALVVCALWASYPLNLWLFKQPNNEIAFLPVFYASALALLAGTKGAARSNSPFFLCGLLAGLSMLIRPFAIGLGGLMAALSWKLACGAPARRRLDIAALVLAGNLLAVLPWSLWASSKAGAPVLLCRGVTAVAIQDGLTFGAAKEHYRRSITMPQDVRALKEVLARRLISGLTVSATLRVFWEESRRRPAAALKLLAFKAGYSFYMTDSGRFQLPGLLIQIPYLSAVGMGIILGFRAKLSRPTALLAVALLVYFWSMTFVSLSIVRYMTPALGLAFVLLPAVWERRGVEIPAKGAYTYRK